MAIKIGGVEPTNITFNGQQANYATLNGTIVWQRVSAVAFTVADTGASFSVSTTTVSWTPPSVGTLVGSPTYSNGQNLGTVSTNTNRTQTFTVTVPNDPQWSNANQNVTFSLSDIQEATVFYPPIISGLVATQDSTTATVANVSWSVNLQGYAQVGQTRVYYNGTQTSTSGTSISLSGMTPGTTESFTIEVDTNQGTGSATTSTYFLPVFAFTDGYVANSFAVNNSGVASATLQGGATGLSIFPSSFDLSCTAITRSATVSFTVPSGYHNSNDTVSNVESTTQPGYGNPAIAATMAVDSGSLTNISSSGASGTHTVTVTNPTSVGEWNIVYSGTGITPSVRSGCGDRTGSSWSVSANTGAARSGTITLYAGSSQTTVLDTLSWSQAAGITYHTHTYTNASSQSNACNEIGTLVDVYTSTSSDPISNGNDIYSNTSLTTFASAGWYSDGFSVGYWSGTGWSNTGLCGF